VGLVNQLILLPLIGFAIVVLFPLKPEIAIGIMILAACPGGPTSNLIAHLANGDTALSVILTALSSFITIITIPFIVNFALVIIGIVIKEKEHIISYFQQAGIVALTLCPEQSNGKNECDSFHGYTP
jgi:predicted Na+-dependent transporter